MFSFFKTKSKSSPPSSPESDPIPSANDFVVVDPNAPSGPNIKPLYPNFGGQFSGGPSNVVSPLPGGRPILQHSDSVQLNYINGVPFKLSSELSTGDSDEITRIQIDDILAVITSKMDIAKEDYDFTLERSILRQNDESDEIDGTADEAE